MTGSQPRSGQSVLVVDDKPAAKYAIAPGPGDRSGSAARGVVDQMTRREKVSQA
jgi:hypothetical protein